MVVLPTALQAPRFLAHTQIFVVATKIWAQARKQGFNEAVKVLIHEAKVLHTLVLASVAC